MSPSGTKLVLASSQIVLCACPFCVSFSELNSSIQMLNPRLSSESVEVNLKGWVSTEKVGFSQDHGVPLHGDEPSDSRILLASTLIIAVGILTTHFFHSDSATSVPVSVRETSEKKQNCQPPGALQDQPLRAVRANRHARSGRNGVYMFVNASFIATDALVTVLCFDLLHDCSLTNWHCCPRPSASASFFMGFESEARGSG